jgi:hypothetical protein
MERTRRALLPAGAIAQTSATPLEVVRTKLLGGRHGQNVGQVVKHLNRKSGKDWPVKQTSGSFGVNVLRVAIQKSVEVRRGPAQGPSCCGTGWGCHMSSFLGDILPAD